MRKLKIGIVGCGAIGSSLAKRICRDFHSQAELVALYDIDVEKAKRLSRVVKKNSALTKESLSALIKQSQLVIEASHASSSWKIAQEALRHKRDIMIMSIGGILPHFQALSSLAKKKQVKVYLPSGAVSGIDALKAANLEKIKSVVLTTRKNPLSFKGVKYIADKKINLSKIKKDTVLFSGCAKEAVKFFPQNINVAALLSIAGIGEKKTLVKIVAAPSTKRNIHEIRIEGKAGVIQTRTENVLHPDNPKTSYLAFLSAVAVLKQILEPVKIGA